MKKKNRRKTRLGLYLKVTQKDGKVLTYRRRSVRAFSSLQRACPVGELYEIRVTYYPNITNKGIYKTKKDLMFAHKCFTNIDELDFVKKYWEG